MKSLRALRGILLAGVRDSLRVRLWLPLYGVSLAFAAIQAAPAISGDALRHPYLSELAWGGADAWVDAALSDVQATSTPMTLWLLSALGMSALYSGAYNFVSGAMLSRWLGARRYIAGGVRYFVTFGMLGVILLVLVLVCAVGAVALGIAAGGVSLLAFLVATQALNMVGECARAFAVKNDRLNPLPSLAGGFGLLAREPVGAVGIALCGVLLHGLLLPAVVLAAGWAAHPLVALVIQQALVLAWLWVKVLRLAWAARLVEADSRATVERSERTMATRGVIPEPA